MGFCECVCESVCVCVYVWGGLYIFHVLCIFMFWLCLIAIEYAGLCLWAPTGICMCVWWWGGVWACACMTSINMSISSTSEYMFLYIYVCVCLFVCMHVVHAQANSCLWAIIATKDLQPVGWWGGSLKKGMESFVSVKKPWGELCSSKLPPAPPSRLLTGPIISGTGSQRDTAQTQLPFKLSKVTPLSCLLAHMQVSTSSALRLLPQKALI